MQVMLGRRHDAFVTVRGRSDAIGVTASHRPRPSLRLYHRAMTIALWILAVAFMLVGLAGTILPAIPGVTLVFLGILVGAWIDGFTRIPVWLVVVCGVLTVVTWVIDYTSAASGAKRLGASRLAVAGALIGTVVGIFTGLWGLLFMPLVGAALGEFIARRDVIQASKVGVATWIGIIVGTAVKLAIAFAMIGAAIVALVF